VPVPRDITELPFANFLESMPGELEREARYDSVRLDAREFEDVEAGGCLFLESAFCGVTFTGGSMRRSRFNDVWAQSVRWVGTQLAEANWLDVELVSGALAGVEMFSAQLRRVRFFGCKLDSVNLRDATLDEVVFSDCVLREVDFGGAGLRQVSFPGSSLDGVRFGKARMKAVDLRGADPLGIRDGIDALKGATISHAQLLDLAPMFAQAAGVIVTDR
jgi:uncharacterized protein YjbI with pentapeptide repeats